MTAAEGSARRPTEPIELTGSGERFGPAALEPPPDLLRALAAICPTDTTVDGTATASRDWWPLAMHWALAGDVPRRAAAVCRPRSTDDVAAVVRACDRAGTPVTPAGGRSGVCGASVPKYGGVILDMTALRGIGDVDPVSGVVEVWCGTFGPDLEDELRERHRLSVGHFPQSFDLATVGGWIASRGAGQYSTRYGKIDDMVVGLEVVLADGTVVRTGGAPAAADGPDLTRLFIGAEGALGVLTRAWLRAHPLAPTERSAAYGLPSFAAGIEACRRVLRAGATPAVLRLYDADESRRSHGGDGSTCVLLVLDEGDERLVDATVSIVDEAAVACGAERLPDALVDAWRAHRNDTSALQALTKKGFVIDTMEIAAPWSRLDDLFERVRSALASVPHARAATCHLSHSYADGACLYFTFAATPPPDEIESTYRTMWDAGQRAALAHGGNLSHHHGVGLNRARFHAEALGAAHDVLRRIVEALDPGGTLNPGAFGLPSRHGTAPWPNHVQDQTPR
jgi:alkyldihydroxyacetonephosphate synthase